MNCTRLFVLGLLVLFPVLAFAGGSTCSKATPLVADGRVTDFDYVPVATTSPSSLYYSFYGAPGRSYSIEVRDDYDDASNAITFALFTTPTDPGCAGAISAAAYTSLTSNALTTTSAQEPAFGSGQRFSFIPANNGAAQSYYIAVSNSDTGSGHYISVSVSDTTFFSPRWSTSQQNCSVPGCTGFHTEFGLTNTTNAPVHVSLFLYKKDGTFVASHGPDVINPHANLFYDTRNTGAGIALNLAVQTSGNAYLVTDAPPGAVQTDISIINAGFSTGPWIQLGSFAPVRSIR